MTELFRIVVAHALAVCVAGCVIGASTVPPAAVTPLRAKVISADRAKDAVVAGKSTKADILAALGETQIISFDSGYEVWVYRLPNDSANTAPAARRALGRSDKAWPATPAEFVILFAPSGLVAKTRIRPAPQ